MFPEGGEAKSLFLDGDRLVVFSSHESLTAAGDHRFSPFGYYASRPCTYGYACDFTGDGRRARASVYDVAEPATPRLLRQLDFDASQRIVKGLTAKMSVKNLTNTKRRRVYDNEQTDGKGTKSCPS